MPRSTGRSSKVQDGNGGLLKRKDDDSSNIDKLEKKNVLYEI